MVFVEVHAHLIMVVHLTNHYNVQMDSVQSLLVIVQENQDVL